MSGSLTETSSLAGASGQGGAYEIEQSMYIGDGANSTPKLQRTCGTPQGTAALTCSTWMKRGSPNTGSKTIFSWIVGPGSYPYAYLEVLNDFPGETGGLHWAGYNGSGYDWNQYYTNHSSYGSLPAISFRDYAAWMHVHLKISGTSAEIYFNGVLFQTGSFHADYYPISGTKLQVGCNNSNQLGSCYFADTYYIDGQALAPSEFGEVNEDTGEWVPIEYSGTYAGNSVYLDYSDSADFGTDSSGLGNDFTATSIPTTQQSLDSPTNNFATLNPLVKPYGTNTYSEGNLKTVSGSGWQASMSTISASSGKWYYETLCGGSNQHCYIIGTQTDLWFRGGQSPQDTTTGTIGYMGYDGKKRIDTVDTSYGATFGSGDIIAVALDLDAGTPTVTFYKNNVSQGVITFTGNILNSSIFVPAFVTLGQTTYWNFGADSSFSGQKTAQGNQDSNGKGDFYYAPPSGFLALCTNNLPDPTIKNPGDHFNTVLYTGTGSGATNAITGVGFAPDLIWLKDRSATTHHGLFDTIRGTGQRLVTHSTGAEDTQASMLSAFGADGFTTSDHHNTVSNNHVAWNWKAGGAASANTDGTINSSVSANTTAGFSIVSYTGSGSAGTVGHGLSQKPDMIILKERSGIAQWPVGVEQGSMDWTDYIALDKTNNSGDYPYWNDTAPTSSVFSLSSDGDVNESSATYIAYCFHSVEGYSKIGAFTGGGNNGAFVYTGFKPAYLLVKSYSNAGNEWFIFDNKINPYNVRSIMQYLQAQSNAAQVTAAEAYPSLDFLSNGIKFQYTQFNPSAYGMLYIAFAESPFKTSNAR